MVSWWALRALREERMPATQQPPAAASPLRRLRMRKHGYWPHTAEVHSKGMLSVSPDSCVFPYIKKH